MAQLFSLGHSASPHMPRPHHSDISIGKDAWIEVADLSGRPQDQAVSLDHLFEPIGCFWTDLEIHCTVACCGFDSFSFWPDDIKWASQSQDAQTLSRTLAVVRQFVELSAADMFVIHRLGKQFDKHAMIQFINHIQHHVILPPVA